MPHKNFLRKILIIAFLFLALVFFNKYILNNFIQSIFYEIVERPGIFLTNKLLKFSAFSHGFLKISDLVKSNAKLKEENNILRGDIAGLESLKRENEFLRRELGVSQKLGAKLLLAKIFSIQKGSSSSTILINRGKVDGVKKSMPVIAAGNVLVGVVDEVFENSSRILSLDDPRLKINARVESSGTLVETRGNLQGSLNVNLVTNKEEIKEGDVILSSGLDNLPESLLIAKIAGIELSSGGLFQKVWAKSIFDPSLGSNLFVILDESR